MPKKKSPEKDRRNIVAATKVDRKAPKRKPPAPPPKGSFGHGKGVQGRKPKHNPTDESRQYVRNMRAFGSTLEQIADVLEIDRKTLMKYYGKEVKTALAVAKTAMGMKVYNQGMKGCTKSQHLFMTTMGGWNPKLEISETQIKEVRSVEMKVKTVTYSPSANMQEAEAAYRRALIFAGDDPDVVLN